MGFKYAEKPADRLNTKRGSDAKNYKENWDTKSWDKIQVPSNIQTQRDENGDFRYDTPIYVNQTYPWANYEGINYNTNGKNKPVAPTVKNSVGQYREEPLKYQKTGMEEMFLCLFKVWNLHFIFI